MAFLQLIPCGQEAFPMTEWLTSNSLETSRPETSSPRHSGASPRSIVLSLRLRGHSGSSLDYRLLIAIAAEVVLTLVRDFTVV